MGNQVCAAYPSKCSFDGSTLVGLIPEEELTLGKLLVGCPCAEHRLKCIRVKARIPRLCGHSHRGRREVLYLFQVEIEPFGNDGQLGHIGFLTSRMRTNEIGNNLLAQVFFPIDSVEDALKLLEQPERRFAHEHQHLVGCVFWSHFQSAAHMLAYQFAGVFAGSLVGMLILALVQQQIVAHATSDETLLDARQSIYGMIDIKQGRMVGIEVGAYGRVDTRRSFAVLTGFQIAAMHAIHVSRWTA